MTDSSANVEVSPKLESPTAILRNIRLIIFPDRVFGNAGASWMTSGMANAPIFSRTKMKYNWMTFLHIIMSN